MQVIGFNFTKIEASRNPILSQGLNINTNIEFTNVEKEKVELLKDKDPVKAHFKFSIVYLKKEEKKDKEKEQEEAKIIFEGFMILATTAEESKEFIKTWKKKELSPSIRLPLFNLILKRCSVKALQLEDELGLPNHMPIPQIAPQKQE